MFVSPRNRYILVEPVETKKKQEERAFVIPTEHEEVDRYKIVKVIEDSTFNYFPGSFVLVPTQVLEKIQLSGHDYYLVTDNYVIAVIVPTEE
jgi:hypothetical protein